MQHVIYQVEYQKALKKQVSAILDTLQTEEFENVSEYLSKTYEEGFLGTMYDLQGQGIPLIFPIDQRQAADAVNHARQRKKTQMLSSSGVLHWMTGQGSPTGSLTGRSGS